MATLVFLIITEILISDDKVIVVLTPHVYLYNFSVNGKQQNLNSYKVAERDNNNIRYLYEIVNDSV